MIPSNYFSHNPDDLRNNYEDDSYSTTNYQPNANISNQHNLPPGSNPLMLQQHHFNDGRAPSRTNYSDVGASLPNNNKSPKLYATPYNDRSFDNNLQNYNNNNYNINDSNLDDFNNDVMNNENDNNNYNINNNNNNNSYNINNNNNNYNSNYNNNNNNSYNINNNNNNYNSNYRDNNDNYNSSPVLNDANFQSPAIASSIHPSSSHLPTEHIRPSDSYLLKENRATPLVEGGILNTSYRPQPSNQSRSQSINKFPLDSTLERPDLSEVIDLLSHQSNSVKANAAAYLQHLSYMDDNIKVQTRGLRGFPPLLDLLSHPDVQVHKAACGALRNLSYGKANDDNKREIVKLGGLTGLTRLLRRSRQDDVQEVVTGIIWNLSSCADLKTTIIDESLKALMDVVVVPLSGWSPSNAPHDTPHYRSTTFRNATSVLRNVSSEGVYARRKMRQCEGLVQSLFQVLLHSTQRQDCDNKSIENCVCVLRNLSFALQEVSDPEYLKKRMAPLHDGDDKAGCFGNKSKLVHKVKHESIKSPPTPAQLGSNPGMALLWSPRLLDAYLPLLKDCSNPDTLEATAGTIQNVTACDWMPSVVFRAAVRKQGGLPIITDLLNYSSDKVICSASTALRNLAIDQENKELIGKQSMRDLVSKLPAASTEPSDYPLSHHTLAALQSTLYQVVKNNLPFTRSLVNEGGVARLVAISKSVPPSYSEKVVRYANHLLYRVWKHTELQEELKRHGWSVEDAGKINQGGRLSADNTINRPIMNQGYQSARSNQPPSNHNTIDYKQPAVNKPNQQRDEEIALDVLHHMQLNDRYAASNGPNYNHNNNNANNNTLNNNNNNNNSLNYNNNNSSLNYTNNNNSLNYNNNNNNNTINNNVGNNTKNSYNSGYDGNYNTNNNNMDAYLNTLNSRGNQGSINNNMYNNNNINSNINSNNDMLNNDNYANDDDNYYNEYNQNNNKDFRGNSDFNLNSSNNNFNNTELFNQNYVANSLRPSTNSQGNNPQQLHRLSNNTQVSNHTNNFNTDAHNLNNNNPNNSYNNNNTTNSYNNNNTNNGYNNNNSNNSNNNNNYNNSQQNIGSFFNTMQGFVAESSPQHLAYH